MDYIGRLKRARAEMKKRGIGMMYLTHGANLWYLTGVRRKPPDITETDSYGDYLFGAYIGADSGLTLVAPRVQGGFFKEEAAGKPWLEQVRIITEADRPEDVLVEVLRPFNLHGKGISVDNRTWIKSGLAMQRALPNSGPFSVASEIIEPMRMVKDADEIMVMKKAVEITDEVYGEILKFIKLGMTEYDVAMEIDYQFVKRGGDHNSFVTGVRFTRSGGVWEFRGTSASAETLTEGCSITFDFGVCYQGYCSDFGRTAFVGQPPAELVHAYNIVLESQAVATRAMASGKVTARQTDDMARNIIEKAGYGKGFVHRVGHGIGITVHEPPFLYRPDETVLTSGMTCTIEPSIHLTSGYSCRVEDVILVTDKGGASLTKSSRDLAIVGS